MRLRRTGDSDPRDNGLYAARREKKIFEGSAAEKEPGVEKANFAHDKETIDTFRTVNRRIVRDRKRERDSTRRRKNMTKPRFKWKNPNGAYHRETLAVRVLGHRLCPKNEKRGRVKEQRGKNTLKTFKAEVQL